MRVLSEFCRELDRQLAARGIEVKRWPPGRSANLIELTTRPKASVLYVKEFNIPGHAGFWGLTKNQIKRLEAANVRWFAVLLIRSTVNGYLLSGQQVLHRVNSGHFELGGDGDYKVNEGTDLAEGQSFRGIPSLMERIL